MNTLDTAKKADAIIEAPLFMDDAVDEFNKAIKKHPLFADKLLTLDKQSVLICLQSARSANDNGHATGSTIFLEEWYEFLEAVQNGDKAAARHELAQCIAILLRIGIHLDDYMANEVKE